MERIIMKRLPAAGASLAILFCILLGILTGCDEIPLRLIIDDLSTKDPEWVLMDTIEAPEGSSNVDFGTSVSVSGDYIIIGDNGFGGTGRAYIYKRNNDNWVLDETLIPSGPNPVIFGFSVDINGTQAVCGDYGEGDVGSNRGAVYIYELKSGVWSEEYYYPGNSNAYLLGYSVGVDEDIVVAGIPGFPDGGSVRTIIKKESGWQYEHEFYASDHATGAGFGKAVDIDGDYIVVGAPNADDGKTDTGKIYIFQFNGINWLEEIIPPFTDSLVLNNHLGLCVSIFDTYAFAGAPDSSSFTALYSRQGDDWSNKSLPAGGEGFGNAAGVAADYAVIGAQKENSNRGEITIYKRSGSNWTQYGSPITSRDGETDDYFGCAVAISSDYCIAGAKGHGTDNEGAVYVYKYTVYETPE